MRALAPIESKPLNFDDPQVIALSQAVARAWTHPHTEHLVMNEQLVFAAVRELMAAGAYVPDRHLNIK